MVTKRSLGWGPFRLLVIAACLAGTAGCTTWKRPPAGLGVMRQGADPPGKMRVTLEDGRRFVIQHPQVLGDSLEGLIGREAIRSDSWDRTEWAPGAVSLSDVREVEIRNVSAGRTLLLVGIGVGATVAIVAIASGGGNETPVPQNPPPSSGGSGDGCFLCSCPLIYSWNGSDWVLDSGTFGGAFLRPLAYTDFDDLEALTASEGMARLRLQAGDQETDHIDELTILAVDHDPGVTVALDPEGGVHTLAAPEPPLAARGYDGRDARALLAAADGRSWESELAPRDTSDVASCRDGLILEFARPAHARSARLVLRANKTAWAAHLMRSFVRAHGSAVSAWYAKMESDSVGSAAFRRVLEEEVHLNVSVWEDGRWARAASVWGGGPEIAKTHAIPIDLSRVRGGRVRVRLESAPSFWLVDYAALDASPERPVVVRELSMASATASDGRDVRGALRAADGEDLTIENEARVEIAVPVPPLERGMAREFLSRTRGWYRFHTPETGPADASLLASVLSRKHGISRTSVAWMNGALRALDGSH